MAFWDFFRRNRSHKVEFDSLFKFELLVEDLDSTITKYQQILHSEYSKDIKELIFFEINEIRYDVDVLFESIGVVSLFENDNNSQQPIDTLKKIVEKLKNKTFEEKAWSQILDKEGATFYINEICNRIQERLKVIENPAQLLEHFNNSASNIE